MPRGLGAASAVETTLGEAWESGERSSKQPRGVSRYSRESRTGGTERNCQEDRFRFKQAVRAGKNVGLATRPLRREEARLGGRLGRQEEEEEEEPLRKLVDGWTEVVRAVRRRWGKCCLEKSPRKSPQAE